MKHLILIASLCLITLSQAGEAIAVFKPGKEDEFISITTPEGKVYHDARVVKVTADAMHFVHSDGAAKLSFQIMPSEVKTRLGWDKLKKLQYATSSASAAVVAPVTDARTVPASSMSEAIRRRAEKDWPQNYTMQKYEIETQAKALADIEALCVRGVEGVPSSKVMEILGNAQKEWPDNPRMILFEMGRQIEAWKKLNR